MLVTMTEPIIGRPSEVVAVPSRGARKSRHSGYGSPKRWNGLSSGRQISWFQISIEEARDLGPGVRGFRSFRNRHVLSVRLALEHKQLGNPAGPQELLMNAHGVAQEQVARSRQQNRWGEACEVAVN